MPSISADGREITVRIRPGIRFTPHPAFGNHPRELIAEDFVYSVKRFFDPVIRAPVVSLIAGKIEGLDELGSRAAGNSTRFDYDAKVSGLVALDRYTVRIRLTKPDPTFVYFLANPDLSIVPREAVEAEGDEFARHPTGSGPYVVREYKPGTRIVLERNATYRAMRWEDVATPSPGDPEWAAALRGRRFPLPDRVELQAIPEPTPGLLALENGEIDVLASTFGAATDAPATALENGRLTSRLAKAGFILIRAASPILSWVSFNMRDPQIGGTATANIALRRAISMAIDDDEIIRVLKNEAATAARYWIPAGMGGYDPAYRYSVRYDPATANALLDRIGYRKARDGYRRRPDGGELTLSMLITISSEARHSAEFWKRTFDRIGVRLNFEFIGRGERGKRVGTCHYQLTGDGWSFDWPDGSNLMIAFYGRDAGTDGSVNMACMEDTDFDALYERLVPTPLGEQRAPLYRRMIERLEVLAPVRLLPTSDDIYITAPNIRGLLDHPAILALYPYLDVTPRTK
jgi:ABC-type transport system substrate-binding protein